MPEVRTIAGRYVLGEVIGSGGTADVHRAHDVVLDRPVAVKLLRENAEAASDRARFTGEIELLARLSHRGLVTVLDAGTTEGDQPYLVMEVVDGPTLRKVMNHGPLDPELVADIGGQLAAALAYAHARHVVHRDVKPGNVLIDTSGRARLADFGIARVIGDTVHHTRTGEAIGTVAYLSPEQVRGEEVGAAADVYSLGLVLLEALAGERAFAGTAVDAAFARLARGPHLPGSLSPGWRRLLEAMTHADPVARPGAADVARELAVLPTGPLAGDVLSTTRRPLTAMSPPAPTGSAGSSSRSTGRVRAIPTRLSMAAAALVALFLVTSGVVADPGPSPRAITPVPAAAPSTSPAATPVAPTGRPEVSPAVAVGTGADQPAVRPGPRAATTALPAKAGRTDQASGKGRGDGAKRTKQGKGTKKTKQGKGTQQGKKADQKSKGRGKK